jgi:hypothetical protein
VEIARFSLRVLVVGIVVLWWVLVGAWTLEVGWYIRDSSVVLPARKLDCIVHQFPSCYEKVWIICLPEVGVDEMRPSYANDADMLAAP